MKSENSDHKALVAVLTANGFEVAAKYIDLRNSFLYRQAVESWRDYPGCLEKYPLNLTKKTFQ
jgi:hypothetical protein